MKGAWTKRLQPHESERWVSRRVLEAYAVSQAGGESEDQSAVVGLADLGGAGGGRLDDAVLVVIATHIDRLRSHEPHGPVRWRFGCSQWQPISAALTSMGKEDECDVSRERCRQEREAARALGQQGREEPARLGGGPVVLGRPGVWRVRNAGAGGFPPCSYSECGALSCSGSDGSCGVRGDYSLFDEVEESWRRKRRGSSPVRRVARLRGRGVV